MNTKVLLVDDDAELVKLIKDYLEDEGLAVDTAHDGKQGVAVALSGNYDIAVLDITMPRQNGIQALTKIRRSSNLPIIMLTARGDDADRIIGLELGADDYVLKPCTPRELMARINAIMKRMRAKPVEPLVLRVGELTIHPAERRVTKAGNELELTSTEFNLLEVLACNAGKPVSKAYLTEEALGRPLGRYDRSIDVHISRIRQKLGLLSNGRSHIQTVIRKGYQLVHE